MVTDQGPLAESEIAQLMAHYEATHAVENYRAFGWHLWPLLRPTLSNDIYMARNYPPTDAVLDSSYADKQTGRLARVGTFYWETLRDYVRYTWDIRTGTAIAPSRSCDVLIFGDGERYQFVGGKWIHYNTDPFVDLIEQAGLRCHTWQWQKQQRSPVARKSANVTSAIRAEMRLTNALEHFRSPPPVPDWYHELAAFYERQLGWSISWEHVVKQYAHVVRMSNIFERWLRRSKPGLVVTDRWYIDPMIAVALAAHRLEIPVMDLQHGVQEQTHSAYHWWQREPPGGWREMPDMFWVWGECTERLFHETNQIQQEVLRGGNLWIRRWLSNTDPEIKTACTQVERMIEGYSQSILVTLPCPAAPFLPVLKNFINNSPESWTWLIRAHPREQMDRKYLERELGVSGRTGVQVHEASDWPLYALLATIDLNVSADSTCPLEALAFGKPSILVTEQGLNFFHDFVERGTMFYAEHPEEFFQTVERALEVDPTRLKQAAQSVFTLDEGDTSRAVNRIAQVVRSVRQKQAAPVGA